MKHTKRKFSVEYKLEVIQRIGNGETENSIANELLLNHGLIRSWVKKYKELGYNGLIGLVQTTLLKGDYDFSERYTE